MPTYEYACQACGQHIEVYQRFKDEPLTECGICGGPLRKVFHPAGILFKGSGFYKTDSRLGRTGAGAKEKAPASSESTAASGSKEATPGSAAASGSKEATPGSAAAKGESGAAASGSGSAATGKEKSA